MIAPPVPAAEGERLSELDSFSILDTLPEQAYDDITYLASQICDTPIALVSFVDADRQWFKSRVGLGMAETPRDEAFCAHAIVDPDEVLVVPDATADPRFVDNPLVAGDPDIRFYAGAPLVTSTGNALGTICVIDRVPRELTPDQRAALEALSRQVMAQLELRRERAQAERVASERTRYAALLEEYQRILERDIEEMSELSITDPLTGLKNRRAFLDRLQEELARCARYGEPLAVALVDVDHFKRVNDAFGHTVGDAVLSQVADVLRHSVRTTDLVARFGGEEFVVLLPSTDTEGAHVLAERLRQAIEAEPWDGATVTVSVGVAVTTAGTEHPDEFVAAADVAMYAAKQAGRNRVRLAA